MFTGTAGSSRTVGAFFLMSGETWRHTRSADEIRSRKSGQVKGM